MTSTRTEQTEPDRRRRSAARAPIPARSDLHPERAFVVQFRAPAGDVELPGGRVEHMTSGAATRFLSATELIGFMRRVLRATSVESPEERR